MLTESNSPSRFTDTPCEKPQGDRVEHGNLERPGAQAHPRASGAVRGGWERHAQRARQWRLH